MSSLELCSTVNDWEVGYWRLVYLAVEGSSIQASQESRRPASAGPISASWLVTQTHAALCRLGNLGDWVI